MKGALRFVIGVGVILMSTFFLDEIELSWRIPVLIGVLLFGLLIAVNLKGVLSMAKGFGENSI